MIGIYGFQAHGCDLRIIELDLASTPTEVTCDSVPLIQGDFLGARDSEIVHVLAARH